MKEHWAKWVVLSAICLSFLMHFQHFSKDLMSVHVWRQTQTQATINSFYEEDMNILNPRRNERGNTEGFFRMEFPLMQWLVANSYFVFGKKIWVSRMMMFIIGIVSILGVYGLLKTLSNHHIPAAAAAWAISFSPCFYYYTINPIPDNLSLATAIWAMLFFFKWLHHQSIHYAIGASLMLAIATLCKLPFILFYILPFTAFILFVRTKAFDEILKLILVFGIPFIGPCLWYLYVIPEWGGNMVIKGVLDNQVDISELCYYLFHTIISTLPELFINYGGLLFFIAGLYYFFKNKVHNKLEFLYLRNLLIGLLAYYFYEINAIADVHDYYLFPFYPLVIIVVSYGAYQFYHSGNWARYLTILLMSLLPLFCYLRMQVRWNPESPGFNKDLLVHKEALRQAVPSDALVVVGNDISHFIFLYYIDKKGWGFDADELSPQKLENHIKAGAAFLYTDSEKIIEDEAIIAYTDSLVLKKGSIEVYKLKSRVKN